MAISPHSNSPLETGFLGFTPFVGFDFSIVFSMVFLLYGFLYG
jgi:hypothetical protein